MRATEKGYTAKMARNITGVEAKIRTEKDEQLHIFDFKGNRVKVIQGKGARVSLRGHKIPENSILTHNHPRALGKSGIEAIGNSFSANDIAIAINNNAAEIRAVTPTYTFSIKRPKGGWGIGVKELAKAYNEADAKRKKDVWSYVGKKKRTVEAVNRANVTYFHTIWKDLAKKYGWKYSKVHG